MERRGPKHSGPFSLACTSCFKSKCKCVARIDGDGCQRCHRLNKPCLRSNSIRRRNVEKGSSMVRITELENRLDDLISKLESRNVIDTDTTHQQSPVRLELQPARARSVQPLGAVGNDAQDSNHTREEGDDNLESAHSAYSPRPVAISEPSKLQHPEAEAETLLDTFRSCMLPHFAFMHLPTNLTAQDLRLDRPFLFRAIVCTASSSTREKVARGRELKRGICDAMLGEENQSGVDKIDLLLALLTYISWGWDCVFNDCNLPWLMLQAQSLASEMRSDDLEPQGSRTMALFTPGFNYSSVNIGEMTKRAFLERHRAVLGCFVLSSIVSNYYSQGDALRWTPLMETGLVAVRTNQSCPTDAPFAIQVTLQLLGQKSAQIYQQQQLEKGQAASTETLGLPALTDLATLQRQLQEIQMLPASGHSHRGLIMAHIHATELQISESTYAINSMVPIMVSQFARIAGTGPTTAPRGVANGASSRRERLQCLWQCVRAAQACTSALLALPPSEFRGISFLHWAQLARCVAALDWLSTTIKDEAWDRTAVKAIVDVPMIHNRLADKLQLVAQANGEQDSDELFTQLARRMRESYSKATGSAAYEQGMVDQEADEDVVYGCTVTRGPVGLMPW